MRWQPGSQTRLAEAALALYGEKGFDNTTVVEIAERSGLTERTFFRYFADKREVLFLGSADLEAHFVDAIADAPASATPIEAVSAALDAIAESFAPRREFSRRRRLVIAASAELRERELIKLASLADAFTAALARRGVSASAARLTAEVAIAVFKIGFERWTEPESEKELAALFRETLDELRTAAAGTTD